MPDEPKRPSTPVIRREGVGDGVLLGSLGQIYVTLAAASQYATRMHLRPEEARRELTEILLDARVQSEGPPMRVRARSRTTQVDASANVRREGRLLVVVSVNAREHLR